MPAAATELYLWNVNRSGAIGKMIVFDKVVLVTPWQSIRSRVRTNPVRVRRFV